MLKPVLSNSNAKIIFINKQSYKNFYKFQPQIKKLKYNCGNNNMTHYIQYDDNVFRLSTRYRHAKQINGVTEHIKEIVANGKSEISYILSLIESQVQNIKEWKFKIDCFPAAENYLPAKTPKQPRNLLKTLLHKLTTIFQ